MCNPQNRYGTLMRPIPIGRNIEMQPITIKDLNPQKQMNYVLGDNPHNWTSFEHFGLEKTMKI